MQRGRESHPGLFLFLNEPFNLGLRIPGYSVQVIESREDYEGRADAVQYSSRADCGGPNQT
jgi:hypothetical protein